ncbi:hypothetical protein ABZ922_03730 [Streptomyces shenzhenensis]
MIVIMIVTVMAIAVFVMWAPVSRQAVVLRRSPWQAGFPGPVI